MATQLATLFLRRLEVPARDHRRRRGARRGGGRRRSAPISRSRSRAGGSPRARRASSARSSRASPTPPAFARLRSRDRGGVRGDRRQAAGLRRARGGRLAGVPARHEHLVALGRARWPPGSSIPERVVGMHFFNPVAVLPLVELVRAEATDDVDARDRLGRDEEARQARRRSSRTRPRSSSTAC